DGLAWRKKDGLLENDALVSALGLGETRDAYGLVGGYLAGIRAGAKHGFHAVGRLKQLAGALKRECVVGKGQGEEGKRRVGIRSRQESHGADKRHGRSLGQETHLAVRPGRLEQAWN